MSFKFEWDNDEKTVLRYHAEGVWNWNDLYKQMRLSIFWLDRVDHPVDTIIDFSRGARMPVGAVGHLRGFGKQDHPNRQPRAFVIGVPSDILQQLGVKEGRYQAADQLVLYVGSLGEARQLIAEWRAAASPGSAT